MRLDLYGEQTGPSQAAGGSGNGLTAYLEGLILFLRAQLLNHESRAFKA